MLEHLSYSSISSYLTCGRNWQYKYIQGVKESTSPELVFGTAFHNTVEQHIATHQPLLSLWLEQWVKATTGVDVEWGVETPEHFHNEGVRILSDKAIQAQLLSIQPMHDDLGPRIERKVELRVPGVPIPIIGYIDLVTVDGVPADFKTSARAWTQDRAESETQPLFYLAALNQAGFNMHEWRFRHYVFTKAQKPQVQVLEHKHSPHEVFWLFEMIRRVWQGIEAESYPINPTSWKCGPKYCNFWNLCRGKTR